MPHDVVDLPGDLGAQGRVARRVPLLLLRQVGRRLRLAGAGLRGQGLGLGHAAGGQFLVLPLRPAQAPGDGG